MKKGKSKRGRFIVIDGPDGAGKTTHVKMLCADLQEHGIIVNDLREPGGTALGEAVRALLLNHGNVAIDALAETFLFQAARAQLIGEVIRPALERGEWVVCDRFTLSTFVYQGCAGGVNKRTVKALSAAAVGGLKPDAYFVLWVPKEVSLARRANRSADRMESKGADYFKHVFDGFHKEAKRSPKRYTLIDGRGEIQEIRDRIRAEIAPLVKQGSARTKR